MRKIGCRLIMIQYVSHGWAYRFSPLGRNGSKVGTYRVKLSSDTNETEFVTDQYLNYLDGYGYVCQITLSVVNSILNQKALQSN